MSPEVTSSTSASATWPTTRTFCARLRSRPALEPRPPRKPAEIRGPCALNVGDESRAAGPQTHSDAEREAELAAAERDFAEARQSGCGAIASRA